MAGSRLLRSWIALGALMASVGCIQENSSGGDSEERLRSLPYAGSVPVSESGAERDGVTEWHEERAFAGHTLYAPRQVGVAFLIGMDGEVVHQWRPQSDWQGTWQHVEIHPNGGLLAIEKDEALFCLDSSGRVGWRVDDRFHHDLDHADDGRILALTRARRTLEIRGVELPVLEDSITIIDPEGQVERAVRLGEVLSGLVSDEDLLAAQEELAAKESETGTSGSRNTYLDLFHTNSVEILRRSIPGIAAAGDVLLSVRELDAVVILDREMRRVRWSWGPGEIEEQHEATLLPRGTILLFDNGVRRGQSRVLEVEPSTGKIVWEYSDGERFFSRSRGGAQRLPNGNTLITESDAGRIFEVMPDGTTVWEYYTPVYWNAKKDKRKRAAVYRAERIDEVALRRVAAASNSPGRTCRAALPDRAAT